MAVGIAVLASNGVAGVWGAVAWLRKDPSIWFWYLLRVAQVTVVLQAVLGFVLFARGMRAPDGASGRQPPGPQCLVTAPARPDVAFSPVRIRAERVSASILSMTLARKISTVRGLICISLAMCLFVRPSTRA